MAPYGKETMPKVKVPAGTDALHPEATEGWQHPLHPASVKHEYPVPESPLIGRTYTAPDYGAGTHKTYIILRVNGDKRERQRTPENCPLDKFTGEPALQDYGASVWAAQVLSQRPLELGPQILDFIRLGQIERVDHATQDPV